MLWAGTVENGVVAVDYSNPEKPVIFHPKGTVPPKLSSQKIISLLPTPGQLAVATGDQELYLIETNGTNWKRLGVVKGLGRKQEIGLGRIANLTLGADGNIYFSSDVHSACVYDQASKTVVPIKLPHTSTSSETDLGTGALQVSAIACDPNGDLWFGTFGNGLFKMGYGKEGYAKTIAIKDEQLSKIFISSLLCHQGDLWIGTKSKGLFLLRKGAETLQNLDPNNQLASKVINAILPDANNDIWISTNKGIAKYDTRDGNFINYTGTNYLQGYEFGLNAAMTNQSDYLFFAGQGGINFFKPTDAKATHSAPEVIISELLINNQSIKPGLAYNDRVVLQRSIEMTDRIVLSYKDKVVGFQVSPIHYYDSKNNIFFYKLEPYEKDWIKRDMSNRFVTYNNLKGGTYTLKVKAQSSEGVFSGEKSIVIKINPPLWQRTWFVVLAYIVVFGLVGMIFGIYLYNQKQREHQLEHEKNMMQSLIDNIPDYICFKDLQSRFTRVNIAQAKLLGLNDPRQAVGKSDFDFFDHAEESYQIEQQIIKTGVPVINQLRTLVIDGISRYISDTKIALYDKDKKCIGTVGVSRDISELKLAENAMLESQAKFKALFDNAPLAIFRIDNKQRIVEYNYRFSTMFGYSKSDDLTVLTTSDLLVDPDLGNLIFETVLETKEVNAEINLKRKDGATFIANLTLALLEEGFNDITIEGIIEDITQMAIARDEIIKAKDKAIEADRLKSLFLANMSHEIRTPMNAIIGFSNMLREDKLTNEDRNYFIDVIQSNGNNLVSLIDSIVDFSKLEADQMSVSLGEFNIHPFIESVVDHTEKSLISEGKGHIRVVKGAVNDKHIRIVSDRHRLNQVLLHLVSNAIKFTDEGEIEIGYLHENKSIKIYVRDTGIGIDKEKHDYIFQRFTKIEDKNKLYGGTGLGLTISKGLIELMGGSIHVDSDTGKGSTFTIILPIQEKIT
jgi:PAS domain S-box-containing protein